MSSIVAETVSNADEASLNARFSDQLQSLESLLGGGIIDGEEVIVSYHGDESDDDDSTGSGREKLRNELAGVSLFFIDETPGTSTKLQEEESASPSNELSRESTSEPSRNSNEEDDTDSSWLSESSSSAYDVSDSWENMSTLSVEDDYLYTSVPASIDPLSKPTLEEDPQQVESEKSVIKTLLLLRCWLLFSIVLVGFWAASFTSIAPSSVTVQTSFVSTSIQDFLPESSLPQCNVSLEETMAYLEVEPAHEQKPRVALGHRNEPGRFNSKQIEDLDDDEELYRRHPSHKLLAMALL